MIAALADDRMDWRLRPKKLSRDAHVVPRIPKSTSAADEPTIPAEPSVWAEPLREIQALAAQGRLDDALDVLYDRADDMLLAGQFDACNELFSSVAVECTDVTILLGILTITRAASERLPGRSDFFRRVREHVHRAAPAEAERLLQGLE